MACSESELEPYHPPVISKALLTISTDSHYPICKIYLVRKGDRNDWDKRIELLSILDEPLDGWDHLTWEVPQGDYVGYATFDRYGESNLEISQDIDLHQDHAWEASHLPNTAKITVKNGSHYPICEICLVRKAEDIDFLFEALQEGLGLTDEPDTHIWLVETNDNPVYGPGGSSRQRVQKGYYVGYATFDVPDGPDIEVSQDIDLHQDYTWEVTY